jgi:hypothetical protein
MHLLIKDRTLKFIYIYSLFHRLLLHFCYIGEKPLTRKSRFATFRNAPPVDSLQHRILVQRQHHLLPLRFVLHVEYTRKADLNSQRVQHGLVMCHFLLSRLLILTHVISHNDIHITTPRAGLGFRV